MQVRKRPTLAIPSLYSCSGMPILSRTWFALFSPESHVPREGGYKQTGISAFIEAQK
jgi:hypothetical protein